MKFGIIGFGKIARKFVASINATSGQVVAVGSYSLSAKDSYLQNNPAVKLYRNYDELLDDPEIQAVYIALPHAMHREWIIKALTRKIPVLCEKPAVLSGADMAEVLDEARKNDTYFLEALKTLFNEGTQKLVDDLPLIGKLEKIEANFCFDATFMKASNSYLFDQVQGGALNDVGPYLIGFANALNKQPVVSVDSTCSKDGKIVTYFNSTVTYANGVVAILEGAIDQTKDRYALVTGEKGTIMIPMFNRITHYQINLDDKSVISRDFTINGDDMTMEIQALIDDVTRGKTQSGVYGFEAHQENAKLLEQINDSFDR